MADWDRILNALNRLSGRGAQRTAVRLIEEEALEICWYLTVLQDDFKVDVTLGRNRLNRLAGALVESNCARTYDLLLSREKDSVDAACENRRIRSACPPWRAAMLSISLNLVFNLRFVLRDGAERLGRAGSVTSAEVAEGIGRLPTLGLLGCEFEPLPQAVNWGGTYETSMDMSNCFFRRSFSA